MSSRALDFRSLRQARERLVELQLAPAIAEGLRATAPAMAEALQKIVLDEVDAFAASGNPTVIPELAAHGRAIVEELTRWMDGEETGDFAFAVAHAHLRAEQRFPLEATLHAYRAGLRALSRWLRDAALSLRPDRPEGGAASTDFAIEFIDAISAAMTAEYVAHTRVVAAAEGDRDAELLNVLLGGYDESDGRIAHLLRANGYLDQRQSYGVIVVRAVHQGEMEQPQRVQRIIAALTDLIAPSHVRCLAGARNGLVVAVVSSLRRLSGWTAPQKSLAARLRAPLLNMGPSVLIGVSADHPSTASIPRATREATAALEFASVVDRVVSFTDLPVRALLIHAGAAFVRSTAPAWLSPLLAADEKAEGALIATLRALADCDLNVQKAGRTLGVHPNTVYARLTRVKDLTGLDGQRLRQLSEMLLAADCAQG